MLVGLLVLCPFLRAQDTLTSATVESNSYALYSQAKWDELIRYGNKALDKDLDFYYLRYRLGVAYFMEKKYRSAAIQFEKAVVFNSSDEAMEYLYYCYIYTAQYDRARWLTKSFSPGATAYTGSGKLKPVSFVALEGGIGTSDSSQQFQQETYVQAGLGLYVNRRFFLFQAATYFTQDAFRGNIKQVQYYIGGNIPLKKGWTVNLGVQPISLNVIPKYARTDSVSDGPPTPKGAPPRRKRPVLVDSTGTAKSKFNFVGSASVSKSFSHFDVTLGTAIGAFDTTSQYEHYLGITYYPLGNNVLFLGVTAYAHTENYYKSLHYGFVPYITVSPLKPLALTISYLHNSGGNLMEDNGYLVSGTPDFMVSRISCLVAITLSKHFGIYIAYQHEDNKEEHRQWPFYYNIYTTGIKYIPI